LRRRRVGYVGADEDGFPCFAVDVGGYGLACLGINVGDQHRCAFGGQRPRVRLADTLRGTRDDRHLACEPAWLA
jgi:hypothetical protein